MRSTRSVDNSADIAAIRRCGSGLEAQVVARYSGDVLDLDHKLGVDEGLAVRPVRNRLLGSSDRTSAGGLPVHAAAGYNHRLVHAAFFGVKSLGTPSLKQRPRANSGGVSSAQGGAASDFQAQTRRSHLQQWASAI
jgi:hypothetical protein